MVLVTTDVKGGSFGSWLGGKSKLVSEVLNYRNHIMPALSHHTGPAEVTTDSVEVTTGPVLALCTVLPAQYGFATGTASHRWL